MREMYMDVSPIIIFRKNHIDFMVTVMAEITTVELLLCDTSIQGHLHLGPDTNSGPEKIKMFR